MDGCVCVYIIGHSPSGLFRTNVENNDKLIFKKNTAKLRIPTVRRQTSWLFTRAAEKLNSGLPRTFLNVKNPVWEQKYEAKDVQSIAIQIYTSVLQRVN